MIDRVLRSIGNRIRQLRYYRGMEQIDLEEKTLGQIKRSSISYFENGKRSPSLKSILILADALHVEPAALFLDPNRNIRHRFALEALQCDDSVLFSIIDYIIELRRDPPELEAPVQHPTEDTSPIQRAV